MSKGGGSTQTTTQTQQLPAWLETAAQSGLKLANQIADRPYTPYLGETVAGFTPQQHQAFGRASEIQGQGQAALQPGFNLAGQAGAFQPSDIQVAAGRQQFMNPYENQVIAAATRDLTDQSAQLGNALRGKAARAGAFGDRLGVQEGVLAGETAKNVGSLSANLRSSGFQAATDQALRAALANQQAGLQGNQQRLAAAGLYGDLAKTASGLNLAEIAALQGAGAQQQALSQQQLADAQRRFIEARDYPLQQLSIRQSALGQTPYGRTTVSEQPLYRNQGAGALGGALLGSQLASATGLPGWAGALGGGLLGFL